MARTKPHLRLGVRVVTTGNLPDADPFTPLVVTEVHKDGTVDVTVQGGGKTWKRVHPRDLQIVPS